MISYLFVFFSCFFFLSFFLFFFYQNYDIKKIYCSGQYFFFIYFFFTEQLYASRFFAYLWCIHTVILFGYIGRLVTNNYSFYSVFASILVLYLYACVVGNSEISRLFLSEIRRMRIDHKQPNRET